MNEWGTRKDGRHYPKRTGATRANIDELKEQERKRQTIRSLNYDSGDYTGANPSRRSVLLDRKRHNKRQPWENR